MIDLFLFIALSAVVGAMVILPVWALWFALRWVIGFFNEFKDMPDDNDPNGPL